MSCRSAILIDNFLEQSKFDTLSAKVAASSEYNTTTVQDTRDALFEDAARIRDEINRLKAKEVGLSDKFLRIKKR